MKLKQRDDEYYSDSLDALRSEGVVKVVATVR